MATKINKVLTSQKQNLTSDELANVSASLSAILGQGGGGSGGEPCASAWRPIVTDAGSIYWELSTSTEPPPTANIMGPEGPSGAKGDQGEQGEQGEQGPQGETGEQGPQGEPGVTPVFQINANTNFWEVSYDNGSTWTSLGTSATGPKGDTGATGATGATGPTGPDGPQGPAGADGKDGKDGTNGADGISPTFTVTQITDGHSVTISGAQGSTSFNVLDGADGKDGKDGTDGTNGTDGTDGFSPTMSFTEAATSVDHENGGTIVTFTYGAAGSLTTAYTAWNGNNGSGGGGSTYTAGEGIDIDNDVISFSGAQVAAGEMILAGNGTVDSPFNTTSFYENYLDNLAAINGDVAVVSAAVAAMGGAIKIIGNASCNYVNNLQVGNVNPGDSYILTDSGTIHAYNAEGQQVQLTAHAGDMAVLGIANNQKTVALLATTPNLTQYAKLNQRTIVKAGVGVTVSHTENSDGAIEYTVNTVGGGGEGTLSAYTVTCSGDNRFDFERSVDPVTSAINYNMTTTMPNFINVTATPTGTLTPNSYYFVYEE